MQDTLSGGRLSLSDSSSALCTAPAKSRRRLTPSRSHAPRRAGHVRSLGATVQPGQLVSPRLTTGFPSLAMH